MPSIARHHAEWLSLLEISGPFLSMPVLLEALPMGLDAREAELAQELRAAYEEWADNQGGLQPDPAIHTAWVRYVLETALDLEGALAEGQAIPEGIKAVIPEYGEVIRPDIAVVPPQSTTLGGKKKGGVPGCSSRSILLSKTWKRHYRTIPGRPARRHG